MSRFYAPFKSVIHRDGGFLQDLEMLTVLRDCWFFPIVFFVLNVGFSCKLHPAADLL